MLILTRRTRESLCIGDDIKIIILGVNGNQVRIGIKAPNDVPVHREELYLRIHGIDIQDEYLKDEQEELLGWQKKE